jgi:23S rRNA pseudouridine2605 synthase
LQKVLAAAGVASRRECEQLIVEGRVEVDGQVVSELGARVDRARQEIRVDGEPLTRPKLVYYAINKPTGVVTTARDPAGRPRVIDLLPPNAGRVFTVGRLDLASDGLILATNDGELANRLTHPKYGIEKTYEVQVAGHPEPDVLAQLRRGVHLAEGYAHAVYARVKSRLRRSSILEMVLDEGRNREVRRLLARVGHKVQRLTRIAVGPIRLGDLPRGAFRKLSQEEVRKLRAAVAAGPKCDNQAVRGLASDRPPRRQDRLRQPVGAAQTTEKSVSRRKIVGGQGGRAQTGGARPADRRRRHRHHRPQRGGQQP